MQGQLYLLGERPVAALAEVKARLNSHFCDDITNFLKDRPPDRIRIRLLFQFTQDFHQDHPFGIHLLMFPSFALQLHLRGTTQELFAQLGPGRAVRRVNLHVHVQPAQLFIYQRPDLFPTQPAVAASQWRKGYTLDAPLRMVLHEIIEPPLDVGKT